MGNSLVGTGQKVYHIRRLPYIQFSGSAWLLLWPSTRLKQTRKAVNVGTEFLHHWERNQDVSMSIDQLISSRDWHSLAQLGSTLDLGRIKTLCH